MLILNLIILRNGTNQYLKRLDQEKINPFIILLAESNDVTYEAYVSEQNLLLRPIPKEPVRHPLIEEIFAGKKGASYHKISN